MPARTHKLPERHACGLCDFPLLPAGLVDGILNLALLTWVSVLASPLNQLHIYPP